MASSFSELSNTKTKYKVAKCLYTRRVSCTRKEMVHIEEQPIIVPNRTGLFFFSFPIQIIQKHNKHGESENLREKLAKIPGRK